MSKYQGLADHLAGQSGKEWRATFDDLSALMGGALPKTARSGVAWWANDAAKPQAKAWLDKGWQVRDVDPKAGVVIFMKADADKPKKAAAKTAPRAKAAPAAAKPKPPAKPKAATKSKAAAAPAPVETTATIAAPPEPKPEPAAMGDEPAFLNRLPSGQKTAVMGGLAAAVLGVGALIARAFLRKR